MSLYTIDTQCHDDHTSDVLQHERRSDSRAERWVVLLGLGSGDPGGIGAYTSLGDAMRAWWERGHETPDLGLLPGITRRRSAADLTWLLDELEIEHTVTPEGAVRCSLPEGRALLLYQHEGSAGDDLTGLWAWCETANGEQCSGGLDTYGELRGLVTAQYHCVSDRWDPSGAVPYDGLHDFLAMCRECHGEAPELTERADGCYYGSDGLRVLVPVAADAADPRSAGRLPADWAGNVESNCQPGETAADVVAEQLNIDRANVDIDDGSVWTGSAWLTQQQIDDLVARIG